jgi:hypothetical protein
LGVREPIARRRIVEELDRHLFEPKGLVYARRQVAEKLGELARTLNQEIVERRQRLGRTEARIAGLIQFISEGDQSSYVRSTLLDLEAHARSEKASIAAIERQARAPIHLPSPKEIEDRAHAIRELILRDPLRGREILRRLLKDGRIVLEPQPDGVYLARTRVFPLLLLVEKPNGGPWDLPGTAVSSRSSGGAQPNPS